MTPAPQMPLGSIVQVKPDKPMFGACLVTVTEIKGFGIQGYAQAPGVPGQAYIRLKWEDIEPTGGMAVWAVGLDDEVAHVA